uniref:Polyketide synthase n=1 Tax=Peronospora matthiolae TaxID=2874970 RepID=A0AAV1V3J3_9STRA
MRTRDGAPSSICVACSDAPPYHRISAARSALLILDRCLATVILAFAKPSERQLDFLPDLNLIDHEPESHHVPDHGGDDRRLGCGLVSMRWA